MGLDVYLGVVVGYKASDIIEGVYVNFKKFPKRDEITGEIVPGKEIKIAYTTIELYDGTEFLVGENRKEDYYQDRPIIDWSKIIPEENLVHAEDYATTDLNRIYLGFSIKTGNSHRSGEQTSIIINEDEANDLKPKSKEALEKYFGPIDKNPEIIAFNIFSY